MIIVYNIEEMAPIPIVYRYASLADLDLDGQDFRLNGPETAGAYPIDPLLALTLMDKYGV